MELGPSPAGPNGAQHQPQASDLFSPLGPAGLRQLLSALKQSRTAGTTFGSKPGSALNLTWLFVVLSAPHFFLNAASFNEFAETTDRFLNTLAVSDD